MARERGASRSTIYDIATMTDSAPSTVSMVLNGSWARYRIKEQTAQRILEASREIGYNVNLKARGLRLSRSGLAGMIIPHYRNRFFTEMAEVFEEKARLLDLCPIVVGTHRSEAIETQVTKTLLNQRVEFLFLTGASKPDPLNDLCAHSGIPCVNIDLPGSGAPSVVSDNHGGSKLLTERLIDKAKSSGRNLESFLFVGGSVGDYATDLRAAGFSEAIQNAGHTPNPDQFVRCGFAPEAARAALASYRDKHGELPGGLFVSSIPTLEGITEYTAKLAFEDLRTCAAGCFDWDPFAARMAFDVTMVRQDVESILATAFAALDPEAQAQRSMAMIDPILVQGHDVAIEAPISASRPK